MMSEVMRYHVQLFKLAGDQQKYAHGALGAVEIVRASDFDRVTAERDALQLRLNASDQRIDELTQRQSENPEGNRERFEKWVIATKHPVFGFLDGRSLARSDDRTGYADEYIQGLWVAYLEFGAEQPKPVSVVPELTPELRWILGQMCFQHIHTAQALRLMGHQIAKKAEDEQAVTIYWMLGHYLKDPANWRQNATAEMKAAAPAA